MNKACRDKISFLVVATKLLSRQKLYLWQLPPMWSCSANTSDWAPSATKVTTQRRQSRGSSAHTPDWVRNDLVLPLNADRKTGQSIFPVSTVCGNLGHAHEQDRLDQNTRQNKSKKSIKVVQAGGNQAEGDEHLQRLHHRR